MSVPNKIFNYFEHNEWLQDINYTMESASNDSRRV